MHLERRPLLRGGVLLALLVALGAGCQFIAAVDRGKYAKDLDDDFDVEEPDATVPPGPPDPDAALEPDADEPDADADAEPPDAGADADAPDADAPDADAPDADAGDEADADVDP